MTEMKKTMLLCAGSVNPALADGIATELGVPLGNVKHEKFANGEIYARYVDSVRGADVFVIQSVCAGNGYDVNDALMELLILTDAAKRASARSVCAVISHYGYARQERKAAPREPITARLVADLISSSGVDRVIALDLHQDAIQGFFDMPVNHMTAMPLFVDYYRKKGFENPDDCFDHFINRVPMHRLCERKDVTNAAIFLLTEDSSYLTGQWIMLAGGDHME